MKIIEELQKSEVGDYEDLENIKQKLIKDKGLEEAYVNYLMVSHSKIHIKRLYKNEVKNSDEIVKIIDRLGEDEEVLMVIRQTKNPLKPGSSLITPEIIFATTKKIIIRIPPALGLRHNVESYPYEQIVDVKLKKGIFSSAIDINVPDSIYDGYIEAIPKDEAEDLVKLIYEKMEEKRGSSPDDDDPLTILKKRFAKGEISKEEYEEMKSVLEW